MKNYQSFCKKLGIEHPIFCGAMYPCSNPELVAAASHAGALGVIQPLSLTYVHGYEFEKGIRYIQSLTSRPLALNLLIEQSSQVYLDRMKKFLDQSLEAGIRIFVTALGKPDWVVKKVHSAGGLVLHDVTDKSWATKAVDAGVDGLICVNSLAGGHAGAQSPEKLFEQLAPLGLPLICAGGVGGPDRFKQMLDIGYSAVQMGTRFLASKECRIGDDYKQAILKAHASDIVLTYKLTGVPVAVINSDFVKKTGTQSGKIGRYFLSHPRLKHWMRLFYSLQSFYGLKKSLSKKSSRDSYWQAGKSVEDIKSIESVSDIVRDFTKEL